MDTDTNEEIKDERMILYCRPIYISNKDDLQIILFIRGVGHLRSLNE